MKALLVGIILLFVFCNSVNATLYTDDFSGYSNYFVNVDLTNSLTDWNMVFDTNALSVDNNYLKFVGGGLKLNCKGAQDVDPRCDILKTITPTDFSDFNANGRWYYWLDVVGKPEQVTRADIRIGASNLTYYSYYNVGTNQNGYVTKNFDINGITTPPLTPAGGGSTFEATTFFSLAVHNDFNTDYNIVFNKVWAEKGSGPFNGVWNPMKIQVRTNGYALPYYDGSAWAMELASSDLNNDRVTGNAFKIRELHQALSGADVNIADYNLHMQASIMKPFNVTFSGNNDRKSQLVFDYIDSNNMKSIYVKDLNVTHATVGIESIVANAITKYDVNIAYGYNTYHTLKSEMNGLHVKLYMDGALITEGDINARVDGNVGIFSQQSTTHVRNWSTELNNIGTFTPSNPPVFPPASQNYFFILIQTIIVPGIFLFLFWKVLTESDNIQEVLLVEAMLIIVWLIINALLSAG